MPRYNNLLMHRFIAQLLHPDAKLSKSYFPASQVFWDCLVQYGSSQLVLPAIYGALKRKKLVHHAPKDLVSFLQEITNLNKNRNKAILKQIYFLSTFFNRHQIDHVFLKGAAVLIAKPYDALCERMLGDIDILISKNELFRAQQLLQEEGFKPVINASNKFNFTKGVFKKNKNRHLKRIFHPDYLAAVELHGHLLKNQNDLIKPEKVLKYKTKSSSGQLIPSKKHLWQHAILNWQYNDGGLTRNILAFRTLVDVLYLESKFETANSKAAPKAIKVFYSLLSLFYTNYKVYYPIKKLIYKWKLQSIIFDKIYSFLRNFIDFITLGFSRMGLILRSRIYRRRILNNPKILAQRVLDFWNK